VGPSNAVIELGTAAPAGVAANAVSRVTTAIVANRMVFTDMQAHAE
jgi:hypothetical protein